MSVPPIDGTLESALYVSDLTKAEEFYSGILGLKVIGRQEGRHVFFQVASSVLLVFNPEATQVAPPPGAKLPVPIHGARGQGHYCFAVDGSRLDEMRAALEAAHVAIEADFLWPNGARSVYVRDPAGNSIEFAEQRLWF
jgi:catechol 2,3-dioxygenase-like lactoylglutathione lyase family enzyme